MLKRLLGILLFPCALVAAAPALVHADDMDLQLSRLSRSTQGSLSREEACRRTLGQDGELLSLRYRDDAGNYQQRLAPDNRRWAQLITQLSPAIAPAVLAPVTTTGPAGFDVSFETNVTGIAHTAQYWETGSRGHGSFARTTCDGQNLFVDPVLTSNRVHFAKGLPLGVTLGATVGKLYDTSLWIVGLDIKLALVEGLRAWPVPDLAVRAAINTAVGDTQYSLTVLSADVLVSRSFVPGRVMTLSPYLGAGMLFTFASSELVDLTPNIDAVACAAGRDPACRDAPAAPSGAPLGASQDDIGHDAPFKDLRFYRYRGFLGLALRYKLFALAAEVMLDLVPPSQADDRAGKKTPRQWTFNAAPSLSF